MTTQLKQKCIKKIEEAFVTAEKHYGRKFLRCPVEFSNRMTTTAGRACFSRSGIPTKIILSTTLLNLNKQEFIDDTPGHEAAHIIAEQLAVLSRKGGAGHGPIWVEVMRVIGQKATRCHQMQTARTLFEVSCSCKVHEVSKILVNRIANGVEYKCKLCKSRLTIMRSNSNTRPKNTVVTPEPILPVKTQSKASKPGSKAEQVRNIIRDNPDLDDDQLIALVVWKVGFKRALAKVYVESNKQKAMAA